MSFIKRLKIAFGLEPIPAGRPKALPLPDNSHIYRTHSHTPGKDPFQTPLSPISPNAEVRTVDIGETLPKYKDNKPLAVTWDTETAINEGFKSSTWVYVCTMKIARAVASVPWIVERLVSRETAGEMWAPVEVSHPLQRLINRPNPHTTRQDMFERIVVSRFLGGNSLTYKLKVDGVPAELWMIGPQGVRPIISSGKYITGYEYTNDAGGKFTYDADDIIHSRSVDPANAYWGMAPIMAAAYSIDCDREASEWQYESFDNRCIADGVFTSESVISETQYGVIKDQIRDQHQTASNARSPWIIGSNVKWQPLSMTPAEMDFIESKKLTREEIAAVHGVPPPIAGILDRATYANIETARQVFWEDTIIPFLDDIGESLNNGLVSEFGDPDKLRIRYDIRDVPALRMLFKKKLEEAKSLHLIGVPFVEINRRLDLGFDRIDGDEVGYIQGAMSPVGTGVTVSQLAQEAANEDEVADSENSVNSENDGENEE